MSNVTAQQTVPDSPVSNNMIQPKTETALPKVESYKDSIASGKRVYRLIYHGDNIPFNQRDFFFDGELKDAKLAAESFCKEMGYKMIRCTSAIIDLEYSMALKKGQR